MQKKYFYSIIVFAILRTGAFAQEAINNKAEWSGYTQLRFTSNFNDVNSFAMRRMKLWVNSAPGFSEHWGFHMQSTITSNQKEKFFLQDVLAFYKQGQFRVNLGQFIPHYSLQRFQPDYKIPLTERANVINALIPNGTLGVRDIGIEGNYSSPKKNIETWFGIFNGYGIKDYRFDNTGIMLTNKTAFYFLNQHIMSGYSAMYRKADQLQLLSVLPDSVKYSGDDVRFNVFARFHSKKMDFQAEYLWAKLDGDLADGYYVLAALNSGKNQVVVSWNQYNDLIESTLNDPVVHLGYNYLAKGDKLKFMLDNGIKVDDGTIKQYCLTLQLQLFFN